MQNEESNGGQLALLEADCHEALLLSREQAAKRYTAATAEKLEHRRKHILDLLAGGWPINRIAERCECSHRVVTLLGQKYAQEVATSSTVFSQVLKAKAAGWVFLADQKAPDAKFHELMVGAGIAIQRAEEMQARAEGVLDPNASVEVSEVNERAEAARKWLAALKSNAGVLEEGK